MSVCDASLVAAFSSPVTACYLWALGAATCPGPPMPASHSQTCTTGCASARAVLAHSDRQLQRTTATFARHVFHLSPAQGHCLCQACLLH
jgi:hypothetical protein